MKINPSSALLTCGLVLLTAFSWAQTTPTGTVNSTTYPQGAIAPDSAKPMSREQKRTLRQNRRTVNQNGQQSNSATTNTSMQNARSQQSSASDGTANNNSNTTNYNSNNATNPATGVGSNPNTTAVQSNQTGSQSGMSGGNSQRTTESTSNAGAVEAVKGAKTSEVPAVKAGSTVRNTSISDFVASSPNFSTLQNAIQSADLVETLRGTGPYTVFAPTNDAFKKLPTAVQGGLLDGSHKDALKQLLTYHVVSGTIDAEELSRQIKSGNGTAQLKTLAGSILTAKEINGRISLTDEQGNAVQVEGAGIPQSNGIVYRISSVLMPKNASFR